VTKDAAATMRTMVAEPYVNHIPTLTGGIGQKDLFLFYRDYVIPSNPPSTAMKLVSRMCRRRERKLVWRLWRLFVFGEYLSLPLIF
jgi:carboxymethylenebutenolidase